MSSSLSGSILPPLPLLLWDTPAGLEQMLAQEGIAYRVIDDPHPLAFRAGRFVLYDGRQVATATVRTMLSAQHAAFDVDVLRREQGADPFRAVISHRSAPAVWHRDGLELTERVACCDRAEVRRRVLRRLREAITRAGGLWARLAPYPYPYRSAFSLRIDLDEPHADDYWRFAQARRPLNDCTTHFVSTAAYQHQTDVLADLRRVDTQSHGHYHVIYRDREANRCNLQRAHTILSEAGLAPIGFAGPHGRWNAGLHDVLEEFEYLYSSDFQIGYDDLPFFPWRGDRQRFSQVLQVPIHPVCEGLFLQAGVRDPSRIGTYLAGVVRAKIEAGEPAFVYGHPERRLGRFPEVLKQLVSEVKAHALLWRVPLTEFAVWWCWRSERRWSVVPRDGGRFEIQFDDWDEGYRLGLEVVRGEHVATVPLNGPRTPLRPDDLAFQRRRVRFDRPEPRRLPRSWSCKALVRQALDWETVTPIEELPSTTLTDRIKKHLRRWRSRTASPNRAEPGS